MNGCKQMGLSIWYVWPLFNFIYPKLMRWWRITKNAETWLIEQMRKTRRLTFIRREIQLSCDGCKSNTEPMLEFNHSWKKKVSKMHSKLSEMHFVIDKWSDRMRWGSFMLCSCFNPFQLDLFLIWNFNALPFQCFRMKIRFTNHQNICIHMFRIPDQVWQLIAFIEYWISSAQVILGLQSLFDWYLIRVHNINQ